MKKSQILDEKSKRANTELLAAARQVIWKLSHSYSPSGNGNDCRPGTIDRTDATAVMLRDALRAFGPRGI